MRSPDLELPDTTLFVKFPSRYFSITGINQIPAGRYFGLMGISNGRRIWFFGLTGWEGKTSSLPFQPSWRLLHADIELEFASCLHAGHCRHNSHVSVEDNVELKAHLLPHFLPRVYTQCHATVTFVILNTSHSCYLRASTAPGNTGNLLKFNWSSWKIFMTRQRNLLRQVGLICKVNRITVISGVSNPAL